MPYAQGLIRIFFIVWRSYPAQWFLMGCITVLLENSVSQLLYMFVLHAVDLAVLVRARPFSNRYRLCTFSPQSKKLSHRPC